MHGVLGGIGVLERHAAAGSQRRAAHDQAVVVLDPLEHARVQRPGRRERRARDVDVLQLAVVVHAQVGNLHAERRDAVAVAALPLRNADVRLGARRRGRSQLPVHVRRRHCRYGGRVVHHPPCRVHKAAYYHTVRELKQRKADEPEPEVLPVGPNRDRHSYWVALESAMLILTALESS